MLLPAPCLLGELRAARALAQPCSFFKTMPVTNANRSQPHHVLTLPLPPYPGMKNDTLKPCVTVLTCARPVMYCLHAYRASQRTCKQKRPDHNTEATPLTDPGCAWTSPQMRRSPSLLCGPTTSCRCCCLWWTQADLRMRQSVRIK